MCEIEVKMECQRLLETVMSCPSRKSDNSSAVLDDSCMFGALRFTDFCVCTLFLQATRLCVAVSAKH